MPQKNDSNSELRNHYVQGNPGERIIEALKAAGKDIDRLTPEELAPIDEFHTLGRQATLELARLAGLAPGMLVLDVGSGLGGPSRCLAATFGCRVTGVDLLEEYCAIAEMLARRAGLCDLVDYRRADALDLPFIDSQFDIVWTQHALMNIEDKAACCRELNRVLKPGGRLAMFDVFKSFVSDAPIHFPVPWARTPETSFLIHADEMCRILSDAGFSVTARQDITDAALETFTKLEARVRKNGLPPLGTHVLLGPEFETMLSNQLKNFQEDLIKVVQVVAVKSPR